MNNNYYVYLHRRKDTNEVFYIGRGRMKRAFSPASRSVEWKNTVKNAAGFLVEFLKQNLSMQESIDVEDSYLSAPEAEWKLVNIHNSGKVLPLDPEYFKKFLEYDESSPSCLRWKVNVSKKMRIGSPAGSQKTTGYWYLRLEGVKYHIHRIVYVMYHGSISPDSVINHINNINSDNKICNLEEVSQAINTRRNVRNKDPMNTGVNFYVQQGTPYWRARYTDLTGKQWSKSFNCISHGHENAMQLAIEYRNKMLLELNRQGAGYNL